MTLSHRSWTCDFQHSINRCLYLYFLVGNVHFLACVQRSRQSSCYLRHHFSGRAGHSHCCLLLYHLHHVGGIFLLFALPSFVIFDSYSCSSIGHCPLIHFVFGGSLSWSFGRLLLPSSPIDPLVDVLITVALPSSLDSYYPR